MNNKELFSRKAGARRIPIASPITPHPIATKTSPEDLIELQRLRDPLIVEQLDPRLRWPGQIRFCGLKEGCWSLEFSPKQFASPHIPLLKTRYKGTMRVERNGLEHTISADLYKFREYLFPLDRLGIPTRIAYKWQNEFAVSEIQRFRPLKPKKCPIYARNKYHSYLQGTDMLYGHFSFANKCSFTLEFDQWYYTHPVSGYDGDFANSADRSIRMEISEISDTQFSGKLYEGAIELGNINLQWRSQYFRSAHLEIFTLEGAEPPPTTVPDGSGGTESFETIFQTAGWKLNVTRNATKMALPSSLSGTNINQCWALDDLHDMMDSTPGYNNAVLDSKWRVFLISVPATLGCSRGVVFDQSTGDTNSIDREGSATFSHDGFNQAHSSNFGAAEDGLMKDWPRGFLRSAAHEVGHAFNQYHQTTQNSIMCPTPSVADALAASGETFPDDIDLSFNATVRHKLIHQPDPAVRPGGMDWATAFGVPEADEINFYDADDLELKVKISKARVAMGEPVDVSWSIKNKMDAAIYIPGSVGSDQHTTRVSVTKPNGEILPMRLPLDAHDDSHILQQLAPGKSKSGETMLFWSRRGFAFDQPGRHEVNIILIWQDNDVYFAVEGAAEVWVNYPVTEKDNEVAAMMLRPEVGRFLLTGNGRRYREGARLVQAVVEKYKNHEVSKIVTRMPGLKYSKLK